MYDSNGVIVRKKRSNALCCGGWGCGPSFCGFSCHCKTSQWWHLNELKRLSHALESPILHVGVFKSLNGTVLDVRSCLWRLRASKMTGSSVCFLSVCINAILVSEWVSEWVSEQGLMSPSTHYRLFLRRVFPVNHLHWYWQLNKNKQEIEHTNNIKITQPKKESLVNSTTHIKRNLG